MGARRTVARPLSRGVVFENTAVKEATPAKVEERPQGSSRAQGTVNMLRDHPEPDAAVVVMGRAHVAGEVVMLGRMTFALGDRDERAAAPAPVPK